MVIKRFNDATVDVVLRNVVDRDNELLYILSCCTVKITHITTTDYFYTFDFNEYIDITESMKQDRFVLCKNYNSLYQNNSYRETSTFYKFIAKAREEEKELVEHNNLVSIVESMLTKRYKEELVGLIGI